MESNNNFEDLYEVLEVHMGSTKKEIIEQYKNKLEPYNKIIKDGKHLNNEELWEVKLLKIAKYVLTDNDLREKYNVSRILNSTEEEVVEEQEQNQNNQPNKYLNFESNQIPLRKDQPINFEQLSDRQFERFDHQNFDLTKDRMLRSSNSEY